jgi:DUF4097 and DUF4098 domain-containing protein YvlB
MSSMKKGAAFAAIVAAPLMAPVQADTDVEQRVPADARGEVNVSNVAGSVSIVGWDRAEVEVTGTIEEGVERVDVARNGNRVTVKVVLPRNSKYPGDAQLVVRVPAASSLAVSTVSADVETRGVTGRMRLKTVSGEIVAEDVSADSDVKSVSGDLRIETAAPITLRTSTVSGSAIVSDLAGEIESVTVSGNLAIELVAARGARLRSTSGDARLTGSIAKDASVDAETVSGDLALRFAAPDGMTAEVETFSGTLENCFGVKPQDVSEYAPGQRMNVVRGDGVAQVRVRTMSGNVRLCDK